jgi:hypothetical protein
VCAHIPQNRRKNVATFRLRGHARSSARATAVSKRSG